METLPKYESLLNLPLGIYFHSMEIIVVTSLVIMAFVLGLEQVVDLTVFCALEPWVRNDPL